MEIGLRRRRGGREERGRSLRSHHHRTTYLKVKECDRGCQGPIEASEITNMPQHSRHRRRSRPEAAEAGGHAGRQRRRAIRLAQRGDSGVVSVEVERLAVLISNYLEASVLCASNGSSLICYARVGIAWFIRVVQIISSQGFAILLGRFRADRRASLTHPRNRFRRRDVAGSSASMRSNRRARPRRRARLRHLMPRAT
jgi:hypothetical protein